MEWGVFLGWLGVMKRQAEGTQTSPDSWRGVENDPWWAEQRRKREEERAQR
jgi:hypothetical protein